MIESCEWMGDGEPCCHPALPGKSYCEHHVWMVYEKGTALPKRKKDMRIAASVVELQSLINECVSELQDEGLDL